MGKKSKIAISAAAVTMLVASCAAKIYKLMPFGAPMFCALSGIYSVWIISPVYLLCEFLFSFELWRLYASAAVVVIISVRWGLGLKFVQCRGEVCKTLFSMLAIFVQTAVCAAISPPVDAALSGFIGGAFYYFAVRAAKCVKNGLRARLFVIDGAAIFAVLFAFGLALGRAKCGGIVLGLAPAFAAVAMSCVMGTVAVLLCGIALSLGLAIHIGTAVVPALAIAAVAFGAFWFIPRPLQSSAAVALFSAVSVLFYCSPEYVGMCAIMLAVGSLPYCVIPKKAIYGLREYFDYSGSARLAVRHYINRVKSDAGNRMFAVASVFDETARLFGALPVVSPDYAAMGKALMDRICPYCPNQKSCDRAVAESAFLLLAERASAGKALLNDLPEFFTGNCACTVRVINESAQITECAAERAKERECEQKAKAIVAERLKSVKDVLQEIGKSQAAPVGFDGEAERKIAFELNCCGVDCAEAFCSADGIVAVVRTATASRERIRRAVNACTKQRYDVSSLDKSGAAGWSVATLKKRARYEAVYARAGIAKSGVSGDSYTFKKMGGRFLTALFDGMGSGGSASESSGAAVELIECFYRAGFDSQSVISGVNRFLTLPASESYSAADVAVIDLDTADADIIKLGSPPCYIKTADTVLKVEGSSLPIGVLEEIRPFVAKKKLYLGQMLILVTDGVSDCFAGDELPEFINGLSARNPETTAKAIVSRALDLCGGEPKDDMTAIAVRLSEANTKT